MMHSQKNIKFIATCFATLLHVLSDLQNVVHLVFVLYVYILIIDLSGLELLDSIHWDFRIRTVHIMETHVIPNHLQLFACLIVSYCRTCCIQFFNILEVVDWCCVLGAVTGCSYLLCVSHPIYVIHHGQLLAGLHKRQRARGGAVGSGTALQAGRSRVLFPVVTLKFFIDIILPAALWPWGRLSVEKK